MGTWRPGSRHRWRQMVLTLAWGRPMAPVAAVTVASEAAMVEGLSMEAVVKALGTDLPY